MYFIELINKIKQSKKQKKEPAVEEFIEDKTADELEDAVTCKHVFMPIDSTNTVLACSKCGFVIKNSKMKFNETDKNPFL